jgi:hypothetical protein
MFSKLADNRIANGCTFSELAEKSTVAGCIPWMDASTFSKLAEFVSDHCCIFSRLAESSTRCPADFSELADH